MRTVPGTSEAGQTIHYLPEPGEEGSVATLVDCARALLVDALEDGRRVDSLMVGPSLYAAVQAAKRRELRAGRPLTVLGLHLRPATIGHRPDAAEEHR
ncbi:hypothetical protein [Streptomyces sp. NPDC057580]|uniref:hypothetical protein n=1 Tax=Streptomyces sp. NPDC057580 TaxID=3346173 RepID=UPI0036C9B220